MGVARRLTEPGGLAELRDQLRLRDALSRVYWVCAFCINQHASICGGYGPPPEDPRRHAVWAESRLNTVTKEFYPLCDCSQLKVFNDKPLRCELNKFDDMMAMLARDGGLTQVIAMDKNFETVSRVWCLAEIVEAEASQIKQKMIVYSKAGIKTHYDKIKTLDITECEASRIEDKQ